MKKKILYIITQGEWGGAQRYVFDLVTNLSLEYDVSIAVGEPNGRKDLQERLNHISHITYQKSNLNVVQLRHLQRSISPIHDTLAIFELAKLYRDLKPDIIHLNSTKAGIIGSLAATNYKLQTTNSVVYTVHGWVFNEPLAWWRRKIYFYLEKWTAGIKDKFIMLSSKESEQGKNELGIPQNKLAVVPHGVSLPPNPMSKPEARRELIKKTPLLPTKDGAIWIGSIANYYETKGLDVLITAIAQIKNIPQNFVCLLIGEGSERSKLEKLISNYKLENKVYLVGSVNDASRFLSAFDLFVLPSRKEGLPYSLLEAKANGVPIVATDVGGVSAIVDKKTGLLIPPNDPLVLGEAILFALNNPKQFQPSTSVYSLRDEIAQTTSLYHSLLTRKQT